MRSFLPIRLFPPTGTASVILIPGIEVFTPFFGTLDNSSAHSFLTPLSTLGSTTQIDPHLSSCHFGSVLQGTRVLKSWHILFTPPPPLYPSPNPFTPLFSPNLQGHGVKPGPVEPLQDPAGGAMHASPSGVLPPLDECAAVSVPATSPGGSLPGASSSRPIPVPGTRAGEG